MTSSSGLGIYQKADCMKQDANMILKLLETYGQDSLTII